MRNPSAMQRWPAAGRTLQPAAAAPLGCALQASRHKAPAPAAVWPGPKHPPAAGGASRQNNGRKVCCSSGATLTRAPAVPGGGANAARCCRQPSRIWQGK